MAKHIGYREISKADWGHPRIEGESEIDHKRRVASADDNDGINTGCLQRIADAIEIMAKNHAELIEDRDKYERWFKSEAEYYNRERRLPFAA